MQSFPLPRTLEPLSRTFGFDRGTPIDRYYMENFLGRHRADVRGRVLESGDATYTKRFGDDRVTQADVLHVPPGGRSATLIGDLVTGAGIPTAAFDCIVLTHVLPFIFDVRAALNTCHAALKPGGVCLATLPCISPISLYDLDRWGDYWRFTHLSARKLFEAAFPAGRVDVESFGNALVATAFVQGMAWEELTREELDHHDRAYECVITIRAVRSPEE